MACGHGPAALGELDVYEREQLVGLGVSAVITAQTRKACCRT
jgi:hypothetical protein